MFVMLIDLLLTEFCHMQAEAQFLNCWYIALERNDVKN